MPIVLGLSLVIRVGVEVELFFSNECYSGLCFENRFCAIRLKKIASIGVWGNGRFPQLNLPSAWAEARARV